jgi:Flp pilus assembly protein CpaB
VAELDVAIPSQIPAGDAAWSPAGHGRMILPRRSLPGGRAVVGGFLIAAAAVVTFWTYTGATRTSRQLYVVAARPLSPGTRITPADLRLAALDMPDASVRSQVFGSTGELVGASVIAAIAPGSLIEASEVVGRGGAPGTREISISIDSSRAVGGTLKPGEFVDILSTFGQGAASYTVVMVPHVEVVTVAGGNGGSIGATPTQVMVLAVQDGPSAEAVADAAVATQLTLVRAAEQPADAAVTTIVPFHPPTGAGGP